MAVTRRGLFKKAAIVAAAAPLGARQVIMPADTEVGLVSSGPQFEPASGFDRLMMLQRAGLISAQTAYDTILPRQDYNDDLGKIMESTTGAPIMERRIREALNRAGA